MLIGVTRYASIVLFRLLIKSILLSAAFFLWRFTTDYRYGEPPSSLFGYICFYTSLKLFLRHLSSNWGASSCWTFIYREVVGGEIVSCKKFERSRFNWLGRVLIMDEIGLALTERIGGSFFIALSLTSVKVSLLLILPL